MTRISSRRTRGIGSESFDTTPPAWAYSDVLGLKAWWDPAAAHITKDGSDFVSSWADRSGTSRTAAQGTGAAQPLWVESSAEMNGLPVVRFDGSNDLVTFTPVSLAAFTAFVVKRDTSTRTAYSGALDWSGTGLLGFGMVSQNANQNDVPHLVVRNGSTETSNTKATNFYATPDASARLAVWSSAPKYYHNGTEDTTSAGDSGYSADVRGAIGRSYSFWKGDIGLVLVYDSVLSAGDMTLVTDEIKTTFGIA